MFCDQCGTVLVHGAVFCHKCGATVSGKEALRSTGYIHPAYSYTVPAPKVSAPARAPAPTPEKAPGPTHVKAPAPIPATTPAPASVPEPNPQPSPVSPISPAASTVQPSAAEPRQHAENSPAPVRSNTVYPHGTHPYHTLGGFLMVFVVCNYICGILCFPAVIKVISLFTDLFDSIRPYSAYLPGGFKSCLIFGMLLLIGILLACAYVTIHFANLIRRKDFDCLHFMQKASVTMMIVSAALYGVFVLWIKQYDYSGSITTEKSIIRFIVLLAGWLIGLLVGSAYFATSVRVRTYMGTDQYLRYSLFNKNTPSPIPADGSDRRPGDMRGDSRQRWDNMG